MGKRIDAIKRTSTHGEKDQHHSKDIKRTPKHNIVRSTLGKNIDATQSIKRTLPLDANVQSIRGTPPPPKLTTKRTTLKKERIDATMNT